MRNQLTSYQLIIISIQILDALLPVSMHQKDIIAIANKKTLVIIR